MTDQESPIVATNSIRRFWIKTITSIAATALLAGVAIAFKAIDDDAGFLVLFLVSLALAVGQLLNVVSKKSIFLRCGTMIALPIFGTGCGMLTTLLVQGDTSKGISEEGPLGYLVVLAASLLFGVIVGVGGIITAVIKGKVTGKSGALPSPLAADAAYHRKAMLVMLAAPTAFVVYTLIRSLILQGFKASPSQDLFTLARTQNQLIPLLRLVDIFFFLVVIGGAVLLLMGAVVARRRITEK